MRRAWWMALLGLALTAWLTQSAQAQPPRGGGGRGGMGGPLVLNESVQKELGLSEDQVKKVKEAVDGVQAKHKDDLEAIQKLDRSERGEKMQTLRKTMGEETEKALTGILKPEQEKRLKEITLQSHGSRAFQDADVQAKLKLNDEQKEKIKTILDDSNKAMRDLFGGGGGNGRPNPDNIKKMETLRKETMDKVSSVLTEDQKKTWQEMTGKEFKIERQGGGRRPDGGR